MKMIRYPGWLYWRSDVKRDVNNIYIFTDNQERTSGSGKIPDDSEYSKRFGKTDLKYPSRTSAVIRGLPNSFPITTQKHYVKGAKRFEGNWSDDDYEEFIKVIDADFEAIKVACKRLKPKYVYFPSNGVLNGQISRLTIERTPKLYYYIVKKELELRDFINENFKDKIKKK
jgi:hypothetical protein